MVQPSRHSQDQVDNYQLCKIKGGFASCVTMFAVLTSLLVVMLTSDVRGAVHPLCGVNARLEKSSGKKSPFIIESGNENPPGSWPWACSVGFGEH